eukprot:TRINITY_DN3645_c0_g3_i2.p2 TRINITY_DN3645_c0_g3~~TRINITY_DN3645_c0_g3_i2.p2  ORF type:complete len:115 (-),score=1.96 TRINITY_DN3645_c0_g3_i2:521-820(-)
MCIRDRHSSNIIQLACTLTSFFGFLLGQFDALLFFLEIVECAHGFALLQYESDSFHEGFLRPYHLLGRCLIESYRVALCPLPPLLNCYCPRVLLVAFIP